MRAAIAVEPGTESPWNRLGEWPTRHTSGTTSLVRESRRDAFIESVNWQLRRAPVLSSVSAASERRRAQAEQQRLVHAWIAELGNPDQRERLAAGVLPLEEGTAAMAADRFRALDHLSPYVPDGVERLQAHLRSHAAFGEVSLAPDTLRVVTRELPTATAGQWAVLQQVRQAVPAAKVFLRERTLAWTVDPKAPRLRLVTVLAVIKDGPLTLRRECLVPEAPCPAVHAT